MRFLIDANLPRAVIAALEKAGHQVEFARDVGLGAAPDEQIAARARESSAALITRDMDFADVRRYPPDQYFGIVVMRLPDTAVALEIVHVLERFLLVRHSSIALWRHAVFALGRREFRRIDEAALHRIGIVLWIEEARRALALLCPRNRSRLSRRRRQARLGGSWGYRRRSSVRGEAGGDGLPHAHSIK